MIYCIFVECLEIVRYMTTMIVPGSQGYTQVNSRFTSLNDFPIDLSDTLLDDQFLLSIL
jgi:hypothetical protein